ncbi:MAG: hypothetical protein JWM16_4422 [Verrucomicrobiales bacterium]|nr:hypothetical protein [Verrucomicrobiales bacterium]
MLLKTVLSLIQKLGIEVSFTPSGRKRAVKLSNILERYQFKLRKAGQTGALISKAQG